MLLISADSHVVEPSDLWEKNLPSSLRAVAPRYPSHPFQAHEGGNDPAKRAKEMAIDGVSGEILYPSLTMDQFGIKDSTLQEACFRVYNDWLINYCSYSPNRLFGVAVISTYNIDNAIREVERCKKAGMRGVMLWQTPPDNLSFATEHYDPLWAVLQDLGLPVSFHILTGAPYVHGAGLTSDQRKDAAVHLTWTVNLKISYAANSLTHLMGSGALERFPRLKVVLVENEVSWLPYFISQWDKYAKRNKYDRRMKLLPSEYCQRQIFSTFFNDPPSQWLFSHWGSDTCMWSNDFPHINSTWPESRKVIEKNMGTLSHDVLEKLLHKNVHNLYNLPIIEPLDTGMN